MTTRSRSSVVAGCLVDILGPVAGLEAAPVADRDGDDREVLKSVGFIRRWRRLIGRRLLSRCSPPRSVTRATQAVSLTQSDALDGYPW